jgi:pimeloyl-ACP methyl ester carboxylesterase
MHEVRFSLPNLSLSGLTSGESNKPLVLCLHGWLDNAASFVPISHYLQDYHLVAIDFAGHGLSQHRSPDAHYHQMDFVHDLHELVLSQGWDQFILLGHSMGGIVGSLYVSSFPEKVSRYITIESFGPLTKTAESSSVQLRESIESRINLQARTAKHPESFENAVRARALAGDLTSQAAEILVNRNLYEQDGELKWRTDRRLRTISSLRVTDDQAISFMQNITCPTLAIRGDSGYKMMREKMQERADWLPELSIIECKGGHHLHMDNPKEVAKHINRFLQDR